MSVRKIYSGLSERIVWLIHSGLRERILWLNIDQNPVRKYDFFIPIISWLFMV